jgi:hypothetical protein
MEWIFQKTGLINHYLPEKQLGNQPIRVLHNIVLYMFIHNDSSFHIKLIEAALSKGMNSQVDIEYGDVPLLIQSGRFRTPQVGAEKKLIIHETFLSYCWIMSYVIFILYVETVNHPKLNKVHGKVVKKINAIEIQKAEELFNYGRSLIVDYTEWDKENLPNPEIYLAENRDYPEQTNMYFTEAIRFVLCHEYIHITEHIDQFVEEKLSDEDILRMEKEADEKAIQIIQKGMTPGREFIYECGIIIGILSMFFMTNNTKQKRHPDLEDRLINAINILGLTDNHMAWGMSCVALKLWDDQFDLQFDWDDEPQSDKMQFYKIIEQIKDRKSNA